jgi:hypothetical protein
MTLDDAMRKSCRTLATLALLIPALSHAAGDAGSCRYVPVAKLPIEYSDASHRAIVMGAVNGTR